MEMISAWIGILILGAVLIAVATGCWISYRLEHSERGGLKTTPCVPDTLCDTLPKLSSEQVERELK